MSEVWRAPEIQSPRIDSLGGNSWGARRGCNVRTISGHMGVNRFPWHRGIVGDLCAFCAVLADTSSHRMKVKPNRRIDTDRFAAGHAER
jgi:hypothetical protein